MDRKAILKIDSMQMLRLILKEWARVSLRYQCRYKMVSLFSWLQQTSYSWIRKVDQIALNGKVIGLKELLYLFSNPNKVNSKVIGNPEDDSCFFKRLLK